MSSGTEIRSFRVDIPDEAIADLRRRIAATRWLSEELVADRSQGVQLATSQALARYWAAEYDWRDRLGTWRTRRELYACARGVTGWSWSRGTSRSGREPSAPRVRP
jgi:Epoxide hydrolase N terminus